MENNNFEQLDVQIERFLCHQMTVEEEKSFIAELNADTEKLQRAKTMALMIRKMQETGLKRDQKIVDRIKETDEEEFRKSVGLSNKAKIIRLSLIRYAVAACIVGILCLGGYKYNKYHKTVSLGNEQYSEYVLDITDYENVRGASDNQSPRNPKSTIIDELNVLFSNVKESKDIGNTIHELVEIYDDAQVESSPYNDFLDDIAWNLAIAYLKDGNREKPIPLLEGMIERNQGYREITKPAQNLINRINDL